MLFNLGFSNNTILSCFFSLFKIMNLYYLIPAVIHISKPISEYVISMGILSNEVKAELEIYPGIV